MASIAIVSSVLGQLSSIIGRELKQEVRLVLGVRKAIKKLSNNFQAIQAVLVDAEQKQVTEKAVGIWLDKLKDASYDIDDVLDEWNTEILKLQIEGVEKVRIPKKVRFVFSSPCYCFRQAVLRHDIGVKIKKISKNLDSIALEKDRYNLCMIKSVKELQKSTTTSFIEVSKICGRENEKNYLVNKLLNEKKETSLPIISIVGMDGIGKTTLAQLAYNDINIKSNFDKRIWVCVSNPFDQFRIAKAIIEGLTDQATTLVEFQSLLEHLCKIIVNKKFLLTLDDVWTEDYEKWEPLYNSLNNGLHWGSKIVVTTRKENVARIMNSIEIINIGKLSIGESWSLFGQLAFCGRSQEECERLENIGREIVGKCKGLPLAIKTIGSLLQFKQTRDQWQRILDSEVWKLEELEKGLFSPLLLSYNDLSSMVKRCFSYCAIFPKDYKMTKSELIKLWMTQGYLGLNQEEELETIGEEVFNTLAMHSLFQDFRRDDDGSIFECKMHDIVHDFIQFLVKNECFTKDINSEGEASLTVSCENACHSMLLLNSSCLVNLSSVEKLRSLVIENKYSSMSIGDFSPNLFEQLTCLRALKLSSDYKTVSEIGKLIHLRYLNISRMYIKELPETLCCLYNLQTLNVGHCQSLEKLPEGIGKLINLRHLITEWMPKFYRPVDLKYMPKSIERLVNLRTLDRFVVGVDARGKGMGTLECLKNLNKLRGYLSLTGLANVVDIAEAKNAQLMNKKNLSGLELLFDFTIGDMPSVEGYRNDSAVLEALQPPPTLERLDIFNCRSTALSPHWMVSLTQLNSLTLKHCIKCECLPPLGKLPLLQSLEISWLLSVKRVSAEFVGMASVVAFPKLRTLVFEYMLNWEDWEYQITGDITMMPSLSSLRIQACCKLKSLPDYLLHATSLKHLKIDGNRFLRNKYRLFMSKFPRWS